MKKIYTLLLLFTITLFYSIPTQAYSLDGNDIDIPELNDLTLNEVFRDGNNIINGNFNNGISSWTTNAVSFTVVDGVAQFLADAQSEQITSNALTKVNGNIYYHRSQVNSLNNVLFTTAGIGTVIYTGGSGWLSLSSTYTWVGSSGTWFLSIRNQSTSSFESVFVDNVYDINLTSLGLTSKTKEQLDYYFQQWELNNAYIEGYNTGYNLGYDEGFDDGVESETSYAVGYALGLSEGEDMETGSSLLILIVALIGFVMMIFGFTTKRGIFNLLSVAAFVVLGGLLIEFVGFIIITFGLVLINIYYAFFGEL
jgi:hypothetical protein